MAETPTYPLLDHSPRPSGPTPGHRPSSPPSRPSGFAFLLGGLPWELAMVVAALHGLAIWFGLGGRGGLESPFPPFRDDHSLYYHSALVTRSFLSENGTTAGYDPAFMSGYPKSIIFPSSSTFPELVIWAFGGTEPARAYKVYVLASAGVVPWLILIAAAGFRASGMGALVAVVVGVGYLWTDFPIQYVGLGMIPYFLAVPIGLVATVALAGFVDRGGLIRWGIAAGLLALAVLVHFTTAMMLVPASAAMYGAGIIRGWRKSHGGRFPITRHLGVWLIPVVVLAVNAFWWWPGIALASTKGESGFALANSDQAVIQRLAQIVLTEAPGEAILVGLGLIGLASLLIRAPIGGVGLATFAAMGFGWGYLAAVTPSLDFLQPGRHTYAFYLAMAVASGVGWSEVVRRLAAGRGRLDLWASLGLLVFGVRVFGPALENQVCSMLAIKELPSGRILKGLKIPLPFTPRAEPFLSSRPTELLTRLLATIDRHMKPGERLIYEEGGFQRPGLAEPFDSGRFSGLLPERCGIEVLGGPYLHASVEENFTQVGEGKLFGEADWGRDRFVTYAKLYRPAAIACWSAKARAFCRSNPDLVETIDDDGRLLFGRVIGFGGATIRGGATVEATPNKLVITDVKPDLDGLAVLRYHSVPCLRGDPQGAWEPVKVDGDPVPFIGVRPSERPIVLRMEFPTPWKGR